MSEPQSSEPAEDPRPAFGSPGWEPLPLPEDAIIYEAEEPLIPVRAWLRRLFRRGDAAP